MWKIFKVPLKVMCIVLAEVLLLVLYIYSQKTYLKNAYPIKYSEYVDEYASEYDLDPFFIYAIIRTESDFTPSATSSIGARGLMQITEDTFNWVKSKLGDKESTFESMYEPQKAVQYGTYLLKYLTETLGSNENVLCGYHAGVNRAKQWTESDDISQNGFIIVDNIPYEDTKIYVNKVNKTYNTYLKLYSK